MKQVLPKKGARKPAKEVPAKAGAESAKKFAKQPAAKKEGAGVKQQKIAESSLGCDLYLSSHQIMEDWKAHPGKDPHGIEGLLEYYRSNMESLRPAIERGSGDALIQALELACFLMAAERMPPWFASEMQDAVRRYTSMEARTLDQAFNLELRKEFVPLSKKAKHGMRAFFDVCCLSAAGVGISNDMYAAISVVYPKGVGRDKIKKFYEEEIKRRGGVPYACRVEMPEHLPQRLHSVYESLTGKRIKK